MKAKQDKVIWLDNGWFPFHYGFCPNEKAWAIEMKRLKVKPGEDAYLSEQQHGRCDVFSCDGNLTIIVSIKDNERNDNIVVGLIVHEAMHVLQHMLAHIGEEKASIEFEAYSIQAITQNLLKAYHDTRGFKGWDYKRDTK